MFKKATAISLSFAMGFAPVAGIDPDKSCKLCGGPAQAVAASVNAGSTNSAVREIPNAITGGSYQIFHHQGVVSTTLASS